MIGGMDCLTTLPLIVGAIGNVSAGALVALAERLLTILLAVFIIGSIGVFAVTAFAWLWVKHAFGEPQTSPVFDDAGPAAGRRQIVIR
jgi:hypothetical protein